MVRAGIITALIAAFSKPARYVDVGQFNYNVVVAYLPTAGGQEGGSRKLSQ